jgi:hypothetical protein
MQEPIVTQIAEPAETPDASAVTAAPSVDTEGLDAPVSAEAAAAGGEAIAETPTATDVEPEPVAPEVAAIADTTLEVSREEVADVPADSELQSVPEADVDPAAEPPVSTETTTLTEAAATADAPEVPPESEASTETEAG